MTIKEYNKLIQEIANKKLESLHNDETLTIDSSDGKVELRLVKGFLTARNERGEMVLWTSCDKTFVQWAVKHCKLDK